jgi:hypothetical protein
MPPHSCGSNWGHALPESCTYSPNVVASYATFAANTRGMLSKMTRFRWHTLGTETARHALFTLTPRGRNAEGTMGQSASHIWHCIGIEKLVYQHLESSFGANTYCEPS